MSISVTPEEGSLESKQREGTKQVHGVRETGESRLQSWMKTGIKDIQDDAPKF